MFFHKKDDLTSKTDVFNAMEANTELIDEGLVEREKARWLIVRAERYFQLGKTDDAINDLQEAIRLDPDIVDAYLYLALCCVKKGYDRNKILKVLLQGLDVPQSKTEIPLARLNICFQLGWYYLEEKDPQNARKYLDLGKNLSNKIAGDDEFKKNVENINRQQKTKTDTMAEIAAMTVKIELLSDTLKREFDL